MKTAAKAAPRRKAPNGDPYFKPAAKGPAKPFPVRPRGDRVIVLRDEAQGSSKGGILLPDQAKEKPKRGTVVAVGPGRRNDQGELVPMDIKVGDRILFSAYSGTPVGDDLLHLDDAHLMMRVEDVLADIVEE
jgi:chaperonin GroES